MFNGYAEVMAYAHEAVAVEVAMPVVLIDDVEHDFVRADILPFTSVFGGFKPWPCPKSDFVLIAECSEISGPNAIYTIPKKQRIVSDLNSLCIRLLSADYQEFSCNKSVINNHTQVLMPDVMIDVHVAANHFMLYDAEARGFVRPLCIAYVTTDKHKLIQLAKPIFKCLSDASLIIQICNRKFCQRGFHHLEMDLKLTKSNLSSCDGLQNICNNPEERVKVYNNLIDSCVDAIHQILDSIHCSELLDDTEKLISDFIEHLNHRFGQDFVPWPAVDSEEIAYKPKLLKVPIQQNFDKRLRNILTMSPGGSLMALYHLNLTYKHFRRKYENIILYSDFKTDENLGNSLCYGACLKSVTCVKGKQEVKKNCLKTSSVPITGLDFHDDAYFSHLQEDIFEILLDFCKSQNLEKSNGTCDLSTLEKHEQNLSPNPDGCNPSESNAQFGVFSENVSSVRCSNKELEENKELSDCVGHAVTLSRIWELIDSLQFQFPDVESVTLKVFQALNQTESILLALLSQSLLVILYSIEEEVFVRIFIQMLAAIVPQNKKHEITVVHHVGKAKEKLDISNTAVVTYSMPCELSELIPPDIMSSVTVLDLTTATFAGPRYVGCLLEGVNERVKKMTQGDPILPFLISVLSDVELQVKFWQSVVTLSETNSMVYLLQKGYTRYDIRIVEALSRLCTS